MVDVKSNTPDIVVDKLNDFFESRHFRADDKNVIDLGETVEIKLVVEKKDESGDNIAANVASIKEKVSNTKEIGIFLDLTLSKIVTPSGSQAEKPVELNELQNVLILNIPLPVELQGRKNYVIYRYHGTEVQEINQTNNDGEYIEVSSDGKTIILHTKKFSTYAIAYDLATPSGGGPEDNGGSPNGSEDNSNAPSSNNGGSNSKLPTSTIETSDGGEIIISKEKKALPYYMENGTRVYIGFSVIAQESYNYIAPAGQVVEFRDNPKEFIDNTIPWAKGSIDFVTERELFVGIKPNVFGPNEAMTRGMFVTVIGRLYERSYGHIVGKNSFADVTPDDYYTRYVGWAHENGIIKGVGDNKFAPKEMVTREQMGAIMRNFAAFLDKADVADTDLAYADSTQISPWAIQGAKYCQETKVIRGRDGGNFAPKGNATRAEVAAVIERFIKAIVK